MFIDTHVHLCDSRYDTDRAEMLKRASDAGVKYHVNIGAELPECRKVAAFEHPGVLKAVGLHPHYIDCLNDEVMEEFRGYFSSGKMAAVGEIGLDYFKSPNSKESQTDAFEKLLSLACEFNLPVVIHSREAHEDVAAVLKKHNPPKRGIIHCYTGDYETAKAFYDMGYLLGIGGVVTFPNSGPLKDTVAKMPLESLVLETDAPWLAPQKVRGKRNEPSYIPDIALAVAGIRGIKTAEVEESTTANAVKLFGLSI